MKPISPQVVKKTWELMAELPEDKAGPLAKRFAAEQPAVIGFLTAVDREILNQHEREVLFYLGLVVWQIMSKAARLKGVPMKAIEDADNANVDRLEHLREASDQALAAAARDMLTHYSQSAVLQYCIEALVEAANENEVRPDNIGPMMIDLKTIVDAFDKQ